TSPNKPFQLICHVASPSVSENFWQTHPRPEIPKLNGSETAFTLHRLAVIHSSAGGGLAPFNLAQVNYQHRVDRFEQTGVAPGV
ncbi:hypothetical protein, partial [Paracoccus sp. PAR01]|uniref:hypothetical protein n=1 Tax=Paracoccus sp. PAR01 TaxID=2769282 RepID=UPI001CE07EEA